MSASIVKTSSAEIRASRINRDDIEALIEMRDQFAKSGAAEIAEHEAKIAEHAAAIGEIKVNLKRLGVSVDTVPQLPAAQPVAKKHGGRRPLDGDTLIERVLGVVIERDRPLNPDEVSVALGLGKPATHGVKATLYKLADRNKIRKVGISTFAPLTATAQMPSVKQRVIDAFKKMPPCYEMKASEVQKVAGAPKLKMDRVHHELGTLTRDGVLERLNRGLYRPAKKDA